MSSNVAFLTGKTLAEDVLIQAAAAKVAEAACTKCEDNKDAFMAVDIGNIFSKSLSAQTSSDEVVRAVSRAVVRLTTADDDRPTVSRSPTFTLHSALQLVGLFEQPNTKRYPILYDAGC